ncbi:hypothetical protein DSO57_1012749 [Entomophthora muscae]|uniref:Uncharacterized protein n=1 Tax=Entomophthora muscae TaxID=34485 RepID=A0ACC2SUR7_9FUNG|nr:hypothetical protein DSO57_1012749 [Entomophthora muscae]
MPRTHFWGRLASWRLPVNSNFQLDIYKFAFPTRFTIYSSMLAKENIVTYDPSLPKFSLIAATTSDRALGYQNDLPWKDTPIPTDMKYFEVATQYLDLNREQLFPPPPPAEDLVTSPKNVVIMGRLTWESMPQINLALHQ